MSPSGLGVPGRAWGGGLSWNLRCWADLLHWDGAEDEEKGLK